MLLSAAGHPHRTTQTAIEEARGQWNPPTYTMTNLVPHVQVALTDEAYFSTRARASVNYTIYPTLHPTPLQGQHRQRKAAQGRARQGKYRYVESLSLRWHRATYYGRSSSCYSYTRLLLLLLLLLLVLWWRAVPLAELRLLCAG